ncbi:unnamed protein product [Rhizophagus irregularis]|nr:unnamed protein product [Rhizophagus irregularis]CAB4403619.1 unnamed protein product [Rhizophagus irregularis]
MADDLANRGRNIPPIGINPKVIPNSLMTPIWDSIRPIDRDIRTYCKNITEAILNNKPLQHLFERHRIQDWIHHIRSLWRNQNEIRRI